MVEFTATELPNGKFVVKAIAEKKPNGDVVMHVPSFAVIKSAVKQLKEKQNNGKRNIQSI